MTWEFHTQQTCSATAVGPTQQLKRELKEHEHEIVLFNRALNPIPVAVTELRAVIIAYFQPLLPSCPLQKSFGLPSEA